jgi:hypothetical protein
MVDEIWINRAISKTGSLAPNTVFLLKDLFTGVEWDKLSPGDKRDFGRQFKSLVNRGAVPNVVFLGKAQNNSSRYKKVIR